MHVNFQKLVRSFIGFPKGKAILTAAKTAKRHCTSSGNNLKELGQRCGALANVIRSVEAASSLEEISNASYTSLVGALQQVREQWTTAGAQVLKDFVWKPCDPRIVAPFGSALKLVRQSAKQLLKPILKPETQLNDILAWRSSQQASLSRLREMRRCVLEFEGPPFTIPPSVLHLLRAIDWFDEAAGLDITNSDNACQCGKLLKGANSVFVKFDGDDGGWSCELLDFKGGSLLRADGEYLRSLSNAAFAGADAALQPIISSMSAAFGKQFGDGIFQLSML